MPDTPQSNTRLWADGPASVPERVARLEELCVRLEERVASLTGELDRVRSARHEDRSEVARLLAAYEQASDDLAAVKAKLAQLEGSMQAVTEGQGQVRDRLTVLERRVLGWGGGILLAAEVVRHLAS